MELSQFTSDSENYDLPAGSTAVAVLGAVLTAPVVAFSLMSMPVAWMVRATTGRNR
ncbi:hypothetical protein ANMWB30_23900 [Arthrobacter sp. MWB30]|nr:hypothetical protein ANMWB30_23900 [Arthrobacter sp. MWB30]